MTPPARNAASAEHDQRICSQRAGMPHSSPSAPVEAAAVIGELRQRVRVWMDSDRILPADGSLLLATLDKVQAGLAGEDAPGAQAAIAAFAGQVQAFIDTGALTAVDEQTSIQAAATLATWILCAGGTGASRIRPP